MNQRLLFITWHELDRNSGGPKASLGFLHCFSQLFNHCTVIYRELADASPLLPANVQRDPCHDTRTRVQKGIDMYRGIPHPLHSHVCDHLRHHSYDIIVIDHSMSAAAVLSAVKASKAKIITIHHNVERHYLRDNRREYPWLYRVPYLHYARKAERDSLLQSDVNLTLTERDAAEFASWHPSHSLHLHPWGIFHFQPIADKTFATRRRGHTFIITGSLCFFQSLLPVIHFIRNHWPLVRQHIPDASLIVAGRDPSLQLAELCSSNADITLVPNPSSMEPLLDQADYYVCPVNMGSGCKLRITDALRAGLPVLCHQVSAAGYEGLVEKECIFTYTDDDSSFRAALTAMTAAPVEPGFIYRSYQQAFSLSTGTRRLQHILQQENILPIHA